MKLKSLIVLVAFLFAVSSVSAQDAGAPDSIKLVALTTLTTGLSTQAFEVACSVFVDAGSLSALVFGLTWDNADLQVDSALGFGDFLAMEIGPFFLLDNDLQTTNDSQIVVNSAASIGNNFPAASGWQHISTFYMTMSNWSVSSTLKMDTIQHPSYSSTDYIFNPLGGSDYDPIWSGPLIISGTAVDESITDILPASFELEQNYPNPFNPSTNIWFDLPTRAKVSLKVFNLLGQEVSTLVDEDLPAGRHLSIWDGRSDNGVSVASGIYFYKLIAESGDKDFVETKKMMLLK